MTTTADSNKTRALISIISITGITGFLVGVLVHPSWHVAVETGQVVAGLVRYPSNNPFYMYHLKVWSLLIQFCAVLLKTGFSEITVSMLVSGMIGMLAFQAFAIVVYAISRNLPISLLAPLFIYLLDYRGYGVMYPIKLMGSVDSFGITGSLFVILTVGLIGAGYFEIGFFLLALSPAVHPSWGAWCCLIVFVVVLYDHKKFRPYLPVIAKYFLAGFILSCLSFSYQMNIGKDIPVIDSDLRKQYLDAFIKNWDVHRMPYRFFSWGEFVGMLGFALSVSVLKKKMFEGKTDFIFKVVLVSFLLSNLLSLITHLPQDIVPQLLLVLMPGRYINFNNIIFAALVLGLLNHSKDITNGKIVSVFFILASLAIFTVFKLRPDLRTVHSGGLNLFDFLKLLLLIVTTSALLHIILAEAIFQPLSKHKNVLSGVYLASVIIIPLFFAPVVYSGIANACKKKYYTYDRLLADTVLKAASERKGMLLTSAKFHRIQLLTRRPVLLDTASLDGFSYAPESGPWFNNILNKVYNMDIFLKPFEEITIDFIPLQTKYFWEKRTLDDWKKIGEEFDVTDVLTRADYRLAMPIVARNNTFILYSIPK